ncbi:uncharacterized protein LOC144703543 [Wolffia australiana]
MALRPIIILLIALIFFPDVSTALYEDQVGVADWHQQYIGKVKFAVFHAQKAGRRRVIVATEENVIASLDLRRGELFWRHVLGDNESVDQIDIAFGKYVITLSSGSILRTWNLPDGQMVWESLLPASSSLGSLFYIPDSTEVGADRQIFVFSGGYIHAVSSIDGKIIWSKAFKEGLEIKHIYSIPNGDIAAVGFSGSSKVETYQLSFKNGDVLVHKAASFPGSLLTEGAFVSNDVFVTLDVTRSIIVLVNLREEITFHQTHVSDIVVVYDSSSASIMPCKLTGMFALELQSSKLLIEVINSKEFKIIGELPFRVSLSSGLFLANGQQAFGIMRHDESGAHFSVKLNTDFHTDVLHEKIKLGSQRGSVERIFLNTYVKTDKSHGFRALIVMEDHSLLLVQQGEVVWSREDGLASIIASTSSDLPLEKGVSVAKVEHSISEWIEGHLLKLKGTLRIASAEDQAKIQRIRLKSSEKTKMTRDHNGFRKLLIVLSRAGKVYALHTGDGRIVWSALLVNPSEKLVPVGIYQWHVPHHHAMLENPSVVVIGRRGLHPDAPGVMFIIDGYSGEIISSSELAHSVRQVMPLPFGDSSDQRLHLIIDGNKKGHVYPRTAESIDTFESKRGNIYWYSVDEGAVRGYSFHGNCIGDLDGDRSCYDSRELWSVIFPSDSEKIIATATRKQNEVVHTQAKAIGNEDVLYKYISKNMIFVATTSPRAAGNIGSATPEEAVLVVYLIDAVTGRIIYRLTHISAQGPVHAVLSENWVVYHYFNLRAHKFEMSVIEVYDQSRKDDKSIWKLVLGKHNLTSPVSAYSQPEVAVKSQTYFFTHSVKTMGVTSTAKGITSKQLLVGTVADQVLAVDKRFLDPRRTRDPSPSEREEGVIPFTDSLPIIPQAYVTHSLQVEGLRGIVTMAAKLESTSLVFAYGVDLFFTRVAPSRTYDSLTEDFSYALLLITIFALVAAILVTWVLARKKELADKWL